MRISDWSSDVCSSDLPGPVRQLEFLALSPSEHQTEFGPDLILKTHQVARAIIALLVKSIRCPIGVVEIAAHDVRSAQEQGKAIVGRNELYLYAGRRQADADPIA